ncbi:SHOCT domain-containing protein [Microbacterium fluvii]|uniref:SHOCT domain-containing protein n=1 Tax=Microbacterium fluvii TaxID=415215 RepID=A0ABW2HDV7_9MICO|nr:SHOCT domain-containing protein [Microbacterium fluvii]MCU4672260.1 SHOCT domain-containing protein [Microbacterium fluvii]
MISGVRFLDDFPIPDDVVQVPGFGEPTGIFAGMGVFMAIFIVIFIGVVVFGIVVAVRKYTVLKNAGIDPLAADAAIAAKLVNSEALRPQAPAPAERTVEERLAELDDLVARGVISADERRDARARILGS